MSKRIHLAYTIFLLLVGLAITVQVARTGLSYYETSIEERPFRADYDLLKPTGLYGHAYGIIGAAMITLGVIIYSGRKRMRRFANVGKIKYYLEFHIFLCLLGPMLVLFHTTFKFGGLVAVSFWSMIAVVLSGVIGRYLYVQIPKGIQGNELSVAELEKENAALSERLQSQFGVSPAIVQWIDDIALPPKEVAKMSLLQILNFFIVNDLTRRVKFRKVYRTIERTNLPHGAASRLQKLAMRRISLTRRIAFLQKFRQFFYYWHVVHLPFALVMFVILFIHVGVAVAFGYTWIF
ncbi:MAG TPA: hypothetical protein VMG09_16470 [Bacteroidota bacterium]|nr:hypothetical protein [Bacteroidota bacterium]